MTTELVRCKDANDIILQPFYFLFPLQIEDYLACPTSFTIAVLVNVALYSPEFQVFGAERPVPKYFVEKLITECVKTKAIENLSVLLYQVSWAADCEASCVPVDLVLEWDTENRNDLLKTLLERKAPARGLPDNSKSPLTICLERDNLELALMLLEYGADGKDLVEEDGDSILHASLRIGLKKGENRIRFESDSYTSEALSRAKSYF